MAAESPIRKQQGRIGNLIHCAKKNFGSIEKLKGRIATVVLRGFLLSLRERGPSAPLPAKEALSAFPDALNLGWNCAKHLTKSATADLSSRKVPHAPMYSLEFLVSLYHLVGHENVEVGMRLSASVISLSVHAGLRLSDIRGIADLAESVSLMHGTLAVCKARKQQHGLPMPCSSLMRIR